MDPHALLLSLAIAIEPLPVLAGVLLLTADRGRPKAIAFLAGWLLALSACAIATIVVATNVTTTPDSTSSTVSAAVDLVLGVALGVAAFRHRAGAGGDPSSDTVSTPTWMAKLDTMSPLVALGLGLFLPPYIVAVAIGNDVVRSGNTTSQMVVAVIIYATIASLGVLVPILVTVVQPERSGAVLARWRAWLERHWPSVLFWLLAVLSAYLLVKGLAELLG